MSSNKFLMVNKGAAAKKTRMDKSFNQRSILKGVKANSGTPKSRGVDVEFGNLQSSQAD